MLGFSIFLSSQIFGVSRLQGSVFHSVADLSYLTFNVLICDSNLLM